MTINYLTIALGLGLLLPFLTAVLARTHDRTAQSIVSFVLAVGAGVLSYTQAHASSPTVDWKQLGIATVLVGVSAAGVRKTWLDQAVNFVNNLVPGFIGRDASKLAAQAAGRTQSPGKAADTFSKGGHAGSG